METELKYKDITQKIIGASFEVHKVLGNGFTHGRVLFLKGIRECIAFQEVIYQRALAWELSQAGLYEPSYCLTKSRSNLPSN